MNDLQSEIVNTVARYGECRVTYDLIDRAFPEPDRTAQAILVAMGHRRDMTRTERLLHFCQENGLAYQQHEVDHMFQFWSVDPAATTKRCPRCGASLHIHGPTQTTACASKFCQWPAESPLLDELDGLRQRTEIAEARLQTVCRELPLLLVQLAECAQVFVLGEGWKPTRLAEEAAGWVKRLREAQDW